MKIGGAQHRFTGTNPVLDVNRRDQPSWSGAHRTSVVASVMRHQTSPIEAPELKLPRLLKSITTPQPSIIRLNRIHRTISTSEFRTCNKKKSDIVNQDGSWPNSPLCCRCRPHFDGSRWNKTFDWFDFPNEPTYWRRKIRGEQVGGEVPGGRRMGYGPVSRHCRVKRLVQTHPVSALERGRRATRRRMPLFISPLIAPFEDGIVQLLDHPAHGIHMGTWF